MYYAFANSLGRPYVSGLDPDAKAYITAIVAAGATVTGAQKTAISDFVVAEKAASRWTGLKRFYLPVWGVAAANAIDMVTLASGTWNGTVTHASGYVEGNGTTGYFDMLEDMVDIGLTISSARIFALCTNYPASGTPELIGSRSGGKNSTIAASTTDFVCKLHDFGSTTSLSVARANQSGIICSNRQSGSSFFVKHRTSSGVATSSVTATASTADPTGSFKVYALAASADDVPAGRSTTRFGLYGLGLGLSDSDCNAFTLNLKTLWETVTGNLLP